MKVYKLKITLEGVEPEVWREVQVIENIYLNDLHEIIQIVMGWENYHLYEFRKDGRIFGVPDDEGWGEPVIDVATVRLNTILNEVEETFQYRYDFGDEWIHTISLLKIMIDAPWPVCLRGERNCPPEDIGGPQGYEEFLETISDPENPSYEDLLEWVGGEFDPEKTDLASVNENLKKAFID